MDESELTALAKSVQTEADFLRFVQALLADRLEEVELEKTTPIRPFGRGPRGWENGTIETFLDAMIAWLGVPDHADHYDAAPSWGLFALALLAGSRYE